MVDQPFVKLVRVWAMLLRKIAQVADCVTLALLSWLGHDCNNLAAIRFWGSSYIKIWQDPGLRANVLVRYCVD